jgi:hypothetical protein
MLYTLLIYQFPGMFKGHGGRNMPCCDHERLIIELSPQLLLKLKKKLNVIIDN